MNPKVFRFRVRTTNGGRDMRVVAKCASDVLRWVKQCGFTLVNENNLRLRPLVSVLQREYLDAVLGDMKATHVVAVEKQP